MKRLQTQLGQATVLACLFMATILGMSALVVDVGSWFRTQRDLQAVADAAALAGAHELPDSTSKAAALATEYTTKNGGASPQISFSKQFVANDTIRVTLKRETPSFFAKVFRLDSVNVNAAASARTSGMSAARYAAPFAVDEKHPLLQCKPTPCFGERTTLDLEKVGPGAFRILNLDNSKGGTGQQILAAWIRTGYDGYMPLGDYNSDSGAKFNASEVKDAMTDMIGKEVLFPIYRKTEGEGANFEYEVIGWVGFVIESFKGNGNTGEIKGYFTRVIWEGLQANTNGNPSFGALAIELVE